MTSDQYVEMVLAKYQVPRGPSSPAESLGSAVAGPLRSWANQYLNALEYSGSYAKGTGVRGISDVDGDGDTGTVRFHFLRPRRARRLPVGRIVPHVRTGATPTESTVRTGSSGLAGLRMPTLVVLSALAMLAGCAPAGVPAKPVQGDLSGPVAWEIAGARVQSVPCRSTRGYGGGAIWSYTIVLRERTGKTIDFESVEMTSGGSNVQARTEQVRFRKRLEANSELRAPFAYGVSFAYCGGSASAWVQHAFYGKDESGKWVQIDIRLAIEPD